MDNSFMDTLNKFVLHYPTWTHLIIAFGIILQAELTTLFSMYLIADGNLTWIGFFTTALITFFITETFLYFSGKNLRGTAIGQHIRKKIPSGDHIERYLRQNVWKVIIGSKFIIGSMIIVMFLAGWSGIKFKKFMKVQIVSALIWIPIMSGIAYSFAYGLWYLKSEKVLEHIEIGLIAIALLVLTGEYFIKKILQAIIFLEEKAKELGKTIEKNLTE